MAVYLPLVFKNNAHRQLESGDTLNVTSLPVSTAAGNLVQTSSAGLYVGTQGSAQVIYVAASGTDSATNGTSASPVKTFAYAVNMALQRMAFPGSDITIALRAGETFATPGARVALPKLSSLTITFWGDATYGDFNNPSFVNSSIASNLSRPIIKTNFYQSGSYWVSTGFDGGALSLKGVRIELPDTPASAPSDSSYGVSDFYLDGNLSTIGVIVNRSVITNPGGLVGVSSRGFGTWSQFGCQLRITNVVPDASAGLTATQLASRSNFTHLYRDVAPGNLNTQTTSYATPVVPASTTSSNGSGILNLMWSDVVAGTIGSNATLASFPLLADPQFGFRNFVSGLVRDQQSRPLNIISGRLF